MSLSVSYVWSKLRFNTLYISICSGFFIHCKLQNKRKMEGDLFCTVLINGFNYVTA